MNRPGALRRRLDQAAPPVILALALLALWEAGVRLAGVPAWQLPAPSAVIAAGWAQRAALAGHVVYTLVEALLGLALALATGVGLAALIDISQPVRRALYPLLVLSQTIPLFVLAPWLVILFGFDLRPKVIVVVLVCFFPIVVNASDGLASADPDILAWFNAMGATRGQIWRKVRLPAALPSLFSGLRIAATYAVIGAVFGEWVGAQAGLGVFIQRSFRASATDQVLAGVVVTALLSIALFAVIWAVERAALPWYYTSARAAQWDEPGIY
ncbi:MAG: ABC transporter permease [Anaerolineae bacterium]|nr:ABC transporter permease [Anaerolineae bacterium]